MRKYLLSSGVVVRGVVARRNIAMRRARFAGRQRELKIAHELLAVRRDARVVEDRGGIAAHGGHVRARGVEVGPVGRLRARDADVVAAVRGEAAERREQVVEAGLRVVEHVRAFDARVIAAHQVSAVSLAGIRQAGGFVHREDEDAARVRAVDHPQVAGCVEERLRIHDVRMNLRVVVGDAVVAEARHAGAQDDLLVDVGAVDRIRHGDAQRRQRRVAAAGVVIEVELVVGEPHDIRRPQVIDLRPGERLPASAVSTLVNSGFALVTPSATSVQFMRSVVRAAAR